MKKPPLGLYIHIPWCVRKCPYCDFNSHANRNEIDAAKYVAALLADLHLESPLIDGRKVNTVFIGGGTPSLFPASAYVKLLTGIRSHLDLAEDAEITLEANPGAADAERFHGYRAAGINRLSIGVQSLDAQKLAALGRIHDPDQARSAVALARAAGFDNVNVDLMFGLPDQSLAQARSDLLKVLALQPQHLSWYQLTVEPNTPFSHRPPRLPDEDLVVAMQEAGQAGLAEKGYWQYEVSAYALPGWACRHNLNYWQFGDYIGIGAGAHGKLTIDDAVVERRWRVRHPTDYLRAAGSALALAGAHRLDEPEFGVEFMLNALRLKGGVPESLYHERTGRSMATVAQVVTAARSRGLLAATRLQATELGWRFLNDLVEMFEPGGGT